MTKVVCWNIAKRHAPWQELVRMDADVALLQETGSVPSSVASAVEVGPHEPWLKHHFDRWPRVVKLSDRVEVEWFKQIDPISEAKEDEIAVSGIGTIDAAKVTPCDGSEPFIAVSMYARWIRPHLSTNTAWKVGYPDGSAHRIISDLSGFIGSYDPSTHRILAAGDLNSSYGSIGAGHERAATVFDRMNALGIEFMGPQSPAGRQAAPTPKHLPEDTKNVPTYHGTRGSPAGAYDQLDYVFASRGFHQTVKVRAMNEVEEWGPSDHCRIVIEVSGSAA